VKEGGGGGQAGIAAQRYMKVAFAHVLLLLLRPVCPQVMRYWPKDAGRNKGDPWFTAVVTGTLLLLLLHGSGASLNNPLKRRGGGAAIAVVLWAAGDRRGFRRAWVFAGDLVCVISCEQCRNWTRAADEAQLHALRSTHRPKG